jgi:hypothetical protein
MKKNFNRLLLGLLICVLMVTVLSVSIELTSAATYSAYVMGYFTESPNGSYNNYGLHLAVSNDGLNWIPLNQNNPVVTPALGTKALRDPHIYRKQDGTFVIVATDNWNSEYIHIWESPDLRTFTERLVHMNTTGMHAWAPETFYDASRSQYAIIWSGNTDRNRIYVSYTTDFVNVTSPQVFFDPGFSVIDGHMEVGINGYNYLYYKNEGQNKCYGTRSTTLNSRSFDNNTYTSSISPSISGSHLEGPIVIKSNTSNTWWLWGDSYIPVNAVFYAWQTNDISTNSWTALSKRDYNAPLNCKHATIAAITATEYDNLIAKWGNPTFDCIKSYNSPDSYIRHANNVGRIDSAPFDPTADMEWKIVPGLADSNGISFESINYPGYYLRNSNYSIVLNANDNSTTFKADATFYKVSGFANSSWTSFRSYVDSTKYIRHSNNVLRIDSISTDTDKQDATFKLCYNGGATSIPTPTPTSTPTVTVTPTPTVTSGYSISYTQSDWGSGASVSITIKNNTSSAVNGWTLAWNFAGNQTITDLWNGTYTQSGTAVTVKNVSYNSTIPANGSVSLGFNITYSGTNAIPTSFTLNGTACQIE